MQWDLQEATNFLQELESNDGSVGATAASETMENAMVFNTVLDVLLNDR